MSIVLTAAATAASSTLMQKLPGIIDTLSDKAMQPDSLIEYTRSTRNDFLTVVEDGLVALPYMPDVMQSLLSIVSGYFLSAVSLVVDVPGIEVMNTLDRLNANRDPMESILGKNSMLLKAVGTESLAYGLPNHNIAIEEFTSRISPRYFVPQRIAVEAFTADDFADLDEAKMAQILQQLNNFDLDNTRKDQDNSRKVEMMEAQRIMNEVQLQNARAQGASNSAINALKSQQTKQQMQMQKESTTAQMIAQDLKNTLTELQIQGQIMKNAEQQRKEEPASVSLGRDTVATLKEISNLSVGKVFNITFARNGNTLDVPVTLALAVTNTDQQSMHNIITFNSNNASFKERLYRAKAGELSYVKDLLFCQDMIEESRRQRIKDKSGFLENMMRRSRTNFWSGLLSAQPSLNNASSVVVISEDTARACQLELGGKLDKFAVRERVFKNTAAMLLVVVDTKWETVRIYHRSLSNYTELSVRELKRSAKGGGNEVEDILKAYSAGSAPLL